jgi:uncharacterized protein
MSAASAKTQEPSMEEILASIRRIIAEDQDAPKDTSSRPETRDAQPEPEDEPEPEDLLELEEPALPEPEPHPEPAALPDLEIAVPEILFSDEPAPEPEPEPEPLPAPEPVRPLEAVLRAAARPPAPEPAVDQRAMAEALLSSAAGASVGQAFNMLSHTVLTQNARTLEDLVKEMLKPMLKMWLDDNLPPLVERLVRAEIERVARGRN